jgi:hypothetical protein
MHYLETTGYNYSKKRCERIVSWFVDAYLPRHKVIINIDHLGLIKQGVFGWMWASDCDYRPREFEIEIHNRMTPENYTKTLLHELWHVYQHVKGLLKDKHNKRLWKGIDHSETDYKNQPWEKQANTMEEYLFVRYSKHLTRHNLSL